MDIAIGILLIIGLYQGIKNGLFVEVASIISFILGVTLFAMSDDRIIRTIAGEFYGIFTCFCYFNDFNVAFGLT